MDIMVKKSKNVNFFHCNKNINHKKMKSFPKAGLNRNTDGPLVAGCNTAHTPPCQQIGQNSRQNKHFYHFS